MDTTWPACRLCSANMKALRETWQLLETRWDCEEDKAKSVLLRKIIFVFIVFISLSLILGEFSW